MKQITKLVLCLILIQTLLACSQEEEVVGLTASAALAEGKSICGNIGWGAGAKQFSVLRENRIHILNTSNELLNAFVTITNNSENDELCFSSNLVEEEKATDWIGVNSFAIKDERFPIESGANLSAQYPYLYCGSLQASKTNCKVNLNTGTDFYCLQAEDQRITDLLNLFDNLDKLGACIISDSEVINLEDQKSINVMGMSFAN
ncbi:MAG: hypothetical protein VX642_03995 [Bdellovibrionota bacterium]|nr:hypothetical protein [Bdellovibrionota bacterium]